MDPKFWRGRKVLVTGHTGFKGAWLSAWLNQLGSQVSGLSLEPAEGPNLWPLLKLEDQVNSQIGDIRDPVAIRKSLRDDPEIVFHMAAQALVRQSYVDPVDTFSTNVTGTVALLQAISTVPSVRAVVVVTSDKVYENLEEGRPFVETDQVGGSDPYSASKGACEIAVWSIYRSLFKTHGSQTVGLATARAGNVIGGGDWADDRLVPDIVRGILQGDGKVHLRAPNSIRPWQHVLDPLNGYLTLAEKLHADPTTHSTGFNFGPAAGNESNVQSVAEGMIAALRKGDIVHEYDANAPGESVVLRLDSSRARKELGWRPVFEFEKALSETANWYADWFDGADMAVVTKEQIKSYNLRLGADK